MSLSLRSLMMLLLLFCSTAAFSQADSTDTDPPGTETDGGDTDGDTDDGDTDDGDTDGDTDDGDTDGDTDDGDTDDGDTDDGDTDGDDTDGDDGDTDDGDMGDNGDMDPDSTAVCEAAAGTLVGSESQITLDSNGVRFTATVGEEPTVPAGYEVVYVLTTSENLIIQDIKPEPSFFVLSPNVYRVHTLVAELSDPSDPDYLDASVIQFGATPAAAVLDIVSEAGICADLFVAGAPFDVNAGGDDDDDDDDDDFEIQPLPCDTIVSTGFVFFPGGQQIDTFDVSDGQADIIDVTPSYSIDDSASVAVLLTDRNYEIVEVFPNTTSFDLDAFPSDKYNVFLLTYTGNLNEDIDGESVYTAQYTDACWLISNNELIIYARSEVGCDRFVTTGIITNRDGERIDTLTVGDRITDGFLIVPTYEILAETAVIVADENYEFLAAYPNTRQVDFEGEGFAPGKYNIFLVTFTGTFNDSIAVGSSVYTITYSNACYLISNNELILYAEAFDPATDDEDDSEDGDSEDGEDGDTDSDPDSTSGLQAIDLDAYQVGVGSPVQVSIDDQSDDAGADHLLTLYDRYGRPLQSVQTAGRTRVEIPVPGIRQGIYIITAQTPEGPVSRQVYLH